MAVILTPLRSTYVELWRLHNGGYSHRRTSPSQVDLYGMTYKSVPGSAVPFRWMSPEAIDRRRFSEASDVWAFGVTAWELLSGGMFPFSRIQSDEEVAKRVCLGERLPRPDGCSDALWRIIEACWGLNPKGRPRFSAIASELVQSKAPETTVVITPPIIRPGGSSGNTCTRLVSH